MKLWTVMFLIMLVIIIGGLYMEKTILKTTNRFSESLKLVKEAVRNDQWSEALRLHDEIDADWRKQKEFWGPFIHNHDMDDITSHLARLKAYLEAMEKGSALAEITMIEIQLVELHQQEVLTWQNVL